eukprot:1983748-Amphidinium_carterae.1
MLFVGPACRARLWLAHTAAPKGVPRANTTHSNALKCSSETCLNSHPLSCWHWKSSRATLNSELKARTSSEDWHVRAQIAYLPSIVCGLANHGLLQHHVLQLAGNWRRTNHTPPYD